MRIFPELCASTLWPFSSSTRNIAFGSGSMTVPSSTIASSFSFGSVPLLAPPARLHAERSRRHAAARAAGLGVSRRASPPRRWRERPAYRPCRRPATARSRAREHLRPVLGDRDRVLEVGRELAVGGDDAPAVVELDGLGTSDVD